MDMKYCQKISWSEVEDLTNQIIEQMAQQNWSPSIVVGITGGGLVPALIISQRLRATLLSLDVRVHDTSSNFGGGTTTWIPEEIKDGHRILAVTSINHTGKTIDWIKNDWGLTTQFLPSTGLNWPWNMIKFASLIHHTSSSQAVDFHGRFIQNSDESSTILFPWNPQSS